MYILEKSKMLLTNLITLDCVLSHRKYNYDLCIIYFNNVLCLLRTNIRDAQNLALSDMCRFTISPDPCSTIHNTVRRQSVEIKNDEWTLCQKKKMTNEQNFEQTMCQTD